MASSPPYPTHDTVVGTTVDQVSSRDNVERIRKIRVLQSMAGIQITTGIILSAMGGTAIVLECYWSRIGNPLWSGICFFMVAGLIGSVSTASGKHCGITLYSVWSALSAVCAAQLVGLAIYATTQELEFLCYPSIDSFTLCTYVREARIGINVCISLVGIVALLASLAASCVSCSVPPPRTTRIVVQAGPNMMEAGSPLPSFSTYHVPDTEAPKPYGDEQPPPYSA
ncbi:uncharacterized protein [Diadema antillarum]|uniref:uncharacterized protein n=1 Tax=Diadema antillarum TaxID=105358 RepID=UPI003A86A6F5